MRLSLSLTSIFINNYLKILLFKNNHLARIVITSKTRTQSISKTQIIRVSYLFIYKNCISIFEVLFLVPLPLKREDSFLCRLPLNYKMLGIELSLPFSKEELYRKTCPRVDCHYPLLYMCLLPFKKFTFLLCHLTFSSLMGQHDWCHYL